jgi:proteasome assembly chaperone (PAC2) family protein
VRDIVGECDGVLYDDEGAAGLAAAVRRAEAIAFDYTDMHRRAERFSAERFAHEFLRAVEELEKDRT